MSYLSSWHILLFVCSVSRQFFSFSLICPFTYVKGSISAWAEYTHTERQPFSSIAHSHIIWPSSNTFLLNILFIYLFLYFSFFYPLLLFHFGSVRFLFCFEPNPTLYCVCVDENIQEKSSCCQQMVYINSIGCPGIHSTSHFHNASTLHLQRMPIMPWWRFDFSIYCPENGIRILRMSHFYPRQAIRFYCWKNLFDFFLFRWRREEII